LHADRPLKQVLDEDDLEELRRKLSLMSVPRLDAYYQSIYLACRLQNGKVPPPRDIQKLVQAWRSIEEGVDGKAMSLKRLQPKHVYSVALFMLLIALIVRVVRWGGFGTPNR
jgi:hypothetical protein